MGDKWFSISKVIHLNLELRFIFNKVFDQKLNKMTNNASIGSPFIIEILIYVYFSLLHGTFVVDIAVGAPFEDDHQGAVYIYNGCQTIPKNWLFSQRITSKDVGMGMSALGFYISKSHVDIDDNLYGGNLDVYDYLITLSLETYTLICRMLLN